MKSTARWIAVLAFAVSTTATADTVDISWASPVIQPNPGDGINWQIIAPAHSGGANAGRFVGQVTAFTGSLTSGSFVDSQANLLAYCYDLLQTLHSGTYHTVNYSIGSATLNWLGAVNYVLNGNSNTWADSSAWLHPTNRNVAAAIQVGIWDSLYDGDFVLNAGNFRASSLEAATLAAYNSFVAILNTANDLPGNLAMVFVDDDNQDVITGRRPGEHQLPEPGSLLLLGIAAAVAGWSLRRKR
jgi:hypothetical protein